MFEKNNTLVLDANGDVSCMGYRIFKVIWWWQDYEQN